jgi:hypothetical protein
LSFVLIFFSHPRLAQCSDCAHTIEKIPLNGTTNTTTPHSFLLNVEANQAFKHKFDASLLASGVNILQLRLGKRPNTQNYMLSNKSGASL